jgi:hypothetical protein
MGSKYAAPLALGQAKTLKNCRFLTSCGGFAKESAPALLKSLILIPVAGLSIRASSRWLLRQRI